MTIFDKSKDDITQNDIDELNKLLCQVEFNTLRKAARKILGDEPTEREVESKFDSLRKKLNKAGYKQNKETRIYEKISEPKVVKSQVNSNKKLEEIEKNIDDKILYKLDNNGSNLSAESSNKKRGRRSKEEINSANKIKQKKEMIKINPLQLSDVLGGTEIYQRLYETQNDEIIWTGAYIMTDVAETFKVVECGCSFIDTYKLIDAAIQLTALYADNLKRHEFVHEFNLLLGASKLNSKKKKQLNLEMSATALKRLDSLRTGEFAIYNKSELINFCMFILAKSAKNSCFKDVELIDLKKRKKRRREQKEGDKKKSENSDNKQEKSDNNAS